MVSVEVSVPRGLSDSSHETAAGMGVFVYGFYRKREGASGRGMVVVADAPLGQSYEDM